MNLHENIMRFVAYDLFWPGFTEIQKKAMPAIAAGNNCLIVSRTGSGKTEAAFIPVFDRILKQKLETLSCVYIAPLRTLINDISQRLAKWCDSLGLSLQLWHSDVGAYSKRKFLVSPSNVLLITPESLESILLNQPGDSKKKLFRDVKYIIVDEAHSFYSTERGSQLVSVLGRIEKYAEAPVQKIGISATAFDPDSIAKWLDPTGNYSVVCDQPRKRIRIKIARGGVEELCAVLAKNQDRKVLIFADSRMICEGLAQEIKGRRLSAPVFVHHSSLGKQIREEAEEKFKNGDCGIMISSGTFELGVDIGDIDFVVNFGALKSAAQARQRIGRAGRRQSVSQCLTLIRSNFDIWLSMATASLINRDVLERKMTVEKPYDIYLHQIIAGVAETGAIGLNVLFEKLRGCDDFKNIERPEFDEVVEELAGRNLVEKIGGALQVGKEFEAEFGGANFRNFYSVFDTPPAFQVSVNEKAVGTLDASYVFSNIEPGEKFVIGGREFVAMEVDYKKYSIRARQVGTGKVPIWFSRPNSYEFDVMQEMGRVFSGGLGHMEEERLLGSVDDEIAGRYSALKAKVNDAGLSSECIHIGAVPDNDEIILLTFGSQRVNNLIKLYIEKNLPYALVRNNSFMLSIKILNGRQASGALAEVARSLDLLRRELETDQDAIFKGLEKSRFRVELNGKFTGYLNDRLYEKLFVMKNFDAGSAFELLRGKRVKAVEGKRLAELLDGEM